MIKWFAKKYCLKIVNDLLKKAKDKCDIEKYRSKILKIVKFLESLMVKLEDNEISDEESEQIIDETKELFE